MRRYAAALLVLAAACSGAGRVRHGSDTLRIGITTSPATLNPLLQTTADEAFVSGLLFQPILAFDEAGNPHPVLAGEVPTFANGGISADGKTIVIHLRKDVRWSDGVPVTARDAVFTAGAAMNSLNNVGFREGFEDVASVRAVDKWTVMYRLKRPNAAILAEIFVPAGGGMILPAHVLGRYASLNHVPFNSDPVGDGPFEIVRWLHGERIVLKANPYYSGGARLSSIQVITIPNPESAVLRLQGGDVDMLYDISSGSYRLLKALVMAGVRTTVIPTNGWDALAFNITHPPLGDPAIRAAIAAALDKRRLARVATAGAEQAASEDIRRRSWAYDPRIQGVRFDAAAARRVLAPKHLSLSLTFSSNSSEARILAIQIQSELAAAGVRVSLKSYDPELLFAPLQSGGVLASGRFDLAIDQYATPEDPDNSLFVTCDQRPPAGLNISRYCKPLLDKYEQSAIGTPIRAKRKKAYAQIESLLARDNPYVYICWQSIVLASSGRIAGFRANGLQMFITSANHWYRS